MSCKEMPFPFMRGSKTAMTIQGIAAGMAGVRDRELREGERRLGGWILPPFQRPPVWTREQQVKLVESIWLELPIGSFVWNIHRYSFTGPCDGWLLDGQQRMTALLAYLASEFEVFGARWGEVCRPHQRRFEMLPQSCIETDLESPRACQDIYERLAYGGTPHEAQP